MYKKNIPSQPYVFSYTWTRHQLSLSRWYFLISLLQVYDLHPGSEFKLCPLVQESTIKTRLNNLHINFFSVFANSSVISASSWREMSRATCISTSSICGHITCLFCSFSFQWSCLNQVLWNARNIVYSWTCLYSDLCRTSVISSIDSAFILDWLSRLGLFICFQHFLLVLLLQDEAYLLHVWKIKMLAKEGTWICHHLSETLNLLSCWYLLYKLYIIISINNESMPMVRSSVPGT